LNADDSRARTVEFVRQAAACSREGLVAAALFHTDVGVRWWRERCRRFWWSMIFSENRLPLFRIML